MHFNNISIYFSFQNPLKFNRMRLLFLIPLPVMLSLMVETASRVAFISFSLCFIVDISLPKPEEILQRFDFCNGNNYRYLYYKLHFYRQRVLYGRLMDSVENRNLAGREYYLAILNSTSKKSPDFGVGILGYSLHGYQVLGHISSPHNVILEILCYTGIIGLSFYYCFYIG